jgi:hypothetical protein
LGAFEPSKSTEKIIADILIDTNIAIFYMKGKFNLEDKFEGL